MTRIHSANSPCPYVVSALAETKQALIDDWNCEHFPRRQRADARDDVVRVTAAAPDEICETVASEESKGGVGWE